MDSLVEKKYSYDELLDAVELQMHKNGLVNVKIHSEFTPGLYTRSMAVPEDTYLLSHIHKTQHQFIMSKGAIIIYTEEEGMVITVAPVLGKTFYGTRRLARTLSEVTWTSIHATDIYPKDESEEAKTEAIRLVEDELFEKRENVFLIKADKELQLCQH